MNNVQQAPIGAPTDLQQPETGERAAGTRRPFILCSRHVEQRRDWVNLPEGEPKREGQMRLFHAVAHCQECQELSWSGQLPPPPEEPQPQGPGGQDTYSWWRDVMGQP